VCCYAVNIFHSNFTGLKKVDKFNVGKIEPTELMLLVETMDIDVNVKFCGKFMLQTFISSRSEIMEIILQWKLPKSLPKDLALF
jgi:hypothetical protein